MPECFRELLMKVAYKLLSRDEATLDDYWTTAMEFVRNRSDLPTFNWWSRYSTGIPIQPVHSHRRRRHGRVHSRPSSTGSNPSHFSYQIQASYNQHNCESTESQHFCQSSPTFFLLVFINAEYSAFFTNGYYLGYHAQVGSKQIHVRIIGHSE